MTNVVVLGAGRVGRHVARDLAGAFEVTAVDADPAAEASLARGDGASGDGVAFQVADLADAGALRRVTAAFDLVINALPGRLGFAALEAAIDTGRPVVDIAFMPEDPLVLHARAQEAGVAAVVDMGVAPGMSNAILGHHVATMKSVERFECLVGGLPVERRWPYEYKAPFSPEDVLEEYTRPARYVENGAEVVRPALTDPERVFVDGIGTLESLNTDGLRTLLRTLTVPNMKEKTLRYPGHGRLMEALRESGFLDELPIQVRGQSIRPRDVASALLFEQWRLEPGEAELTVMRVTVEGVARDGVREVITWDLLDRGDREAGVSSMARATAYPCAAAVHLVANGGWRRAGVSPPEHVAADDDAFRFLLRYQEERGVIYRRTTRREA